MPRHVESGSVASAFFALRTENLKNFQIFEKFLKISAIFAIFQKIFEKLKNFEKIDFALNQEAV